MAFYFGNIRRKFEKNQLQLRKEYDAAGMTEEQSSSMYELDLYQLNRDIAYATHTQALEPETDDDSESVCAPYRKTHAEAFTVFQKPTMTAQFWWIDEIDNPVLVNGLKRLSYKELVLIDCLAFRELTQSEVSNLFGLTQGRISQQVAAIRRKLGTQLCIGLVCPKKTTPPQKGGEE